MSVKNKTKIKLQNNFSEISKVSIDKKGYTTWPQENLVPDVELNMFEDDLRKGDGNELRMKFCAILSSSALAVNSFAPFKNIPEELIIFGQKGAKKCEFEKQFKIFSKGTPPNLDIVIDRGSNFIAIESKFLEYFDLKKPKFAKSYEKLSPPKIEPSWWGLYQEAKFGASQYLDRAQLIKHYFGLYKHLTENHSVKITLLYLFWEPVNWEVIDICKRHRKEIETISKAVSDSKITFRWMTYNQLWDEWEKNPNLKTHVHNLKSRYQISI